MDMILKQIDELLARCGSSNRNMPSTHFYNEGWLLKLILDRYQKLNLKAEEHALAIPNDNVCRWYSEAPLSPAFPRRPKANLGIKDESGETHTKADGVIGHFEFGKADDKGALKLKEGASHFVVLEAKMYSPLSSGVKNDKMFNQAARYLACIAKTLKGRSPQDFNKLAFYVLAPERQIKQLETNLTYKAIYDGVRQRAQKYMEGSKVEDTWFDQEFVPVLNYMTRKDKETIKIITWESLIDDLKTFKDNSIEQLETFYCQCKKYNDPKSMEVCD